MLGERLEMTERDHIDVIVSCLHGRCEELVPSLREEIARHGLADDVTVLETTCRGMCAMGPVVLIQPDGLFYTDVQPSDVPDLVKQTLIEEQVIQRLTYKKPETHDQVCHYEDTPFYRKQLRQVMRQCGTIDPESIEEYIAAGGYEALATVLTKMTPDDVIEEVKQAGIRGRGGAGFPTGRKWAATREAKGGPKYVVANGDEGDPGAFMNRSLMEGDPHAILEGLAIGGYAVGANQGFIYVRDEYPLAVRNLNIALTQAREYGLLGEDILGSGFSFDVKIVRGAGAFVCGESSALMQSLEGKVGEPRPKHYHATERGLFDRPTALNNVETLANIPQIINRGAEAFASVGTAESKGTKTFCLVGQIVNTGLIEVPMGLTLREIIYDIGGGVPDGKAFKAVQTGGPSGGCLPASLQDLAVDYDSLVEAGSMMGSGGMIVMDDHTCMVDIARYFLDFLAEESCGKCTPCREGIRLMLDILTRITEGTGEMSDLTTLEQLATTVQSASLCGLGKSAPNPVLSTLRYFADEYVAHIQDKKCPAGVCRALISYSVIADNCTGCGLCVRKCPQDAITGETKQPHLIDEEKCIKCGICYDVCNFDAVAVM
jgi:NADH:ubiquinone oxidoreductase subunit F (NADH-binding)/(2Fe-2S) ferredoxin/NAD-dependent dihydropyrimidine dehydrogenase PreA subunit